MIKPPPSPTLPPPIISSHRLASGLAARVIHDISGAASGLTMAMELLADQGSDDLQRPAGGALDLTTSSARTLMTKLEYLRAAYGPADLPVASEALGRLAASQFTGRRVRLDWAPEASVFPGPVAQALLILAQIAAGALAAGGAARVLASEDAETFRLTLVGDGPRPKLAPDILGALDGRPVSETVSGRWAHALFLHTTVAARGGTLRISQRATGFTFEVSHPAPAPGSRSGGGAPKDDFAGF